MKKIVILGLMLVLLLAFQSQTIGRKGPQENSAGGKKKNLELSIRTDRHIYKRHGKLTITAVLTNTDYVEDIFVYGTLGWGHLSSLSYTLREASGKRIQPAILADDLTLPISDDDTSSFTRLPPDHFLGTDYRETLDRLNLTRPGKYSIVVEYHSPVSNNGVNLNNFWGKEDGSIRSNTLWIEVR